LDDYLHGGQLAMGHITAPARSTSRGSMVSRMAKHYFIKDCVQACGHWESKTLKSLINPEDRHSEQVLLNSGSIMQYYKFHCFIFSESNSMIFQIRIC
jgi:hypothetical protein